MYFYVQNVFVFFYCRLVVYAAKFFYAKIKNFSVLD